MPSPTVTLDIIEQASLEYGTATGTPIKRFVRPCYVEGMDVSGAGGNLSEALWLAGAAVEAAAAASPLAAARADMALTRIFLEPTTDRAARGRILYELPTFGAGQPPSTYLIRDAGTMRTFETNRLPGTHEPLECSYDSSAAGGYGGVASGFIGDDSPQAFRLTDRIIYTVMAPLRAIEVNALIYGRPTNGAQDAITYANNASWPTGAYPGGTTGLVPKAKGYWRLDNYQTDYAVYNGYYTLRAFATTKVTEDWSESGTLRNAQTGRFVRVTPESITTLMSGAYTYGITNGNGIQRVGFYPLISFPALFGF